MTTSNAPRLAKIRLHPIKSLDPVEVDSVSIARHGMLRQDRSFALFEGSGDIIKAKDKAEIHQLHADIDLPNLTASFRFEGNPIPKTFHLENDRPAIGEWLSEQFGRPVKLQRDDGIGFADDWTAPGPTLVSTATLESISSWYDDLPVEEVRRRLRANLEVDGVPAFWEDQLYGPQEGDLVSFKIGSETELLGKNSCQRCPVPMRDTETGEKTPRFAKIFTTQRKATLQPWAHPDRFDHYYRVAINTIPGAIADDVVLKVGDPVIITESTSSNP